VCNFCACLSASACLRIAVLQEQKKDYNAVRKAIEDMLDVEGYDDGSYGPLLVSGALWCHSVHRGAGPGGEASRGGVRGEDALSASWCHNHQIHCKFM
jgi:hypothetical protein